MSKSKHTPGPWTEENGLVSAGKGLDRIKIASMHWAPSHQVARPEQQDANARLIAAAPELLEELADLLGVIQDEPGEGCEARYSESDPIIIAARAAIAKATK